MSIAYRDIISIEPGRRGGRPCLRGTRIAVSDVLGWLAEGLSEAEIVADFPELTADHVRRVSPMRRIGSAGC